VAPFRHQQSRSAPSSSMLAVKGLLMSRRRYHRLRRRGVPEYLMGRSVRARGGHWPAHREAIPTLNSDFYDREIRMTLRQVEAFLAVVRARTFSRAARTIHLSQSTLSEHVSELEQKLGKPLLSRWNESKYAASGRLDEPQGRPRGPSRIFGRRIHTLPHGRDSDDSDRPSLAERAL